MNEAISFACYGACSPLNDIEDSIDHVMLENISSFIYLKAGSFLFSDVVEIVHALPDYIREQTREDLHE